MRVSYACSPPVLPVNGPATLDVLITFHAKAPEGPRPPRRPLNLSLVIDRSGSMAGEPLKQAIKAAEALVERLEPDDVLSVVVYDDHVDTVLEPQHVGDKDSIRQRIRKVRAGGCTNLSAGWLKGCEHVLAQRDGGTINRVLLLTDGLANQGVTKADVLIKTAREKAEAGVVTTTLGFGSKFDEDLLIGMARAAGGNFYFIQTPDDAASVFEIEAESLAVLAAQNLTVSLTPAPGGPAEVGDLLSDYRTERKAGGVTIVAMGDAFQGEDKTLALEVTVPAQRGPHAALPLFNASYTYEEVTDDGIRRSECQLPLGVTVPVVTAERAAEVAPDVEILLRVSRIRIARAKDAAIEQADRGDRTQAADTLRRAIADLRAKGLDERFEIAEEIAQLEHFAAGIARGRLDAASRKEMRDQSYQARARGRTDLAQRGVAGGSARDLEPVNSAEGGVELACYREGGKLRIRVVTEGYNPTFNVQFPRTVREAGVHYVVDALQLSADGTFYRAVGKVRRLVLPGQEDRYGVAASPTRGGAPKASKISARTAADLETTTSVGDGVLVQCVKEGSKLRARVVSDGYDPAYNMRFPRDIREEGTLYVVDEVIEASGGGSYIACGMIRRLVQ
jgi:Ca-activated chloride channel family protein